MRKIEDEDKDDRADAAPAVAATVLLTPPPLTLPALLAENVAAVSGSGGGAVERVSSPETGHPGAIAGRIGALDQAPAPDDTYGSIADSEVASGTSAAPSTARGASSSNGRAKSATASGDAPDSASPRHTDGRETTTIATGDVSTVPNVSVSDAAPRPAVSAHVASADGTPPPVPIVNQVPLAGVPVEIGLRSMARINHFEIRLAPEDLGRIDVKLDIDVHGGVKAHLIVDRPDTLSFLQRDAVSLERALDQAGPQARRRRHRLLAPGWVERIDGRSEPIGRRTAAATEREGPARCAVRHGAIHPPWTTDPDHLGTRVRGRSPDMITLARFT